MDLQAQPSLRSRADVVKTWVATDLKTRLGILPGFEDLHHKRCSVCDLWPANPLKHIQDLVSPARQTKPVSLLCSIEGWNSGSEHGCLLCRLVSSVSAHVRYEASSSSGTSQQVEAVQLSVTPTRQDFPHCIFVLGLRGHDKKWQVAWQVELYAASGVQTYLPQRSPPKRC